MWTFSVIEIFSTIRRSPLFRGGKLLKFITGKCLKYLKPDSNKHFLSVSGWTWARAEATQYTASKTLKVLQSILSKSAKVICSSCLRVTIKPHKLLDYPLQVQRWAVKRHISGRNTILTFF